MGVKHSEPSSSPPIAGTEWDADHLNAQAVFNVLDYGALGNGSNDDTAEIQAAMDACNSAGGGVVYFPPGTYLVSGTPHALVYKGNQIVLRGAGPGDDEYQYATTTSRIKYNGTGSVLGNSDRPTVVGAAW